MFHITAPWHPCGHPMGMWHCLSNYVTSQWVDDVIIDTKESCDQQPKSLSQDPGKHGYFTGKHGYFTSTIRSNHTSQDKECLLFWRHSHLYASIVHWAPWIKCKLKPKKNMHILETKYYHFCLAKWTIYSRYYKVYLSVIRTGCKKVNCIYC